MVRGLPSAELPQAPRALPLPLLTGDELVVPLLLLPVSPSEEQLAAYFRPGAQPAGVMASATVAFSRGWLSPSK